MIYDAAVIGAGVVGALIGRELTKYKLSVCILEKENDVAMGSSRANSAIVHAGFDAESGTLKAKLNVRGSQMMEKLAQDLGVSYRRNGSLVIGLDENDMDTIRVLYERGLKNGVEGLEIVGKERLKELEPQLSDQVVGALHAPTGAIICPYDLTISAVGNAMDNGAELRLNFTAEKIEWTGEYYRITSDGDMVEARYLIDAAGLYADEVAKLAREESFAIRPRRGEYLLLDKECGWFSEHTVFRTPTKMGKGILITPTVDGNLLLGPTSENIDDKEDTEVTAAGIQKIIGEALGDMPKVPYRKVITSFCGLRATAEGGDFIIRPAKGNPHFILAAGIDSPGLSSAPAIAEYVAELLKDAGLSMEPNPKFIPVRESTHWFRKLSNSEKNKVIENDPKFGRVICRCETVTEGEIIDAIRRNPQATTLDAVKRRTRSGMGRCQGGFCSPYIVEILSRELDIPFEEVTKSGKGSYLNVGKTK